MTIRQAIEKGVIELKVANVETPKLKARLLMQYVLNKTRQYIIVHDTEDLLEVKQNEYFRCIDKLKKGYPIEHITHQKEFMKLNFFVNGDVLIPRQDTEILVESVLEKGKQYHFQTGLDIGTGTGCIPISLEKYGNFKMMAVDISPQALVYAQKNNVCNQTKVQFLQSDLYTAIPKETKFDFIVSNPPYIETAEIEDLMEEVRVYEPHNALDGGTDGLDFYRRILEQAQDFLKNDGWIFFEIGCTQRKDLLQLLEQTGFDSLESRQDLAGLDRVVMGRKKGV